MTPDVFPISKYCLSSDSILNASLQFCLLSGSAALIVCPTVTFPCSSVVLNWQFLDFKQAGAVKYGASLTSMTFMVRLVVPLRDGLPGNNVNKFDNDKT